jgi:hypothetical protein
LPVLVHLTVTLDLTPQNDDVGVDLRVVIVQDIEVHTLNLIVDQAARADVAVQTADLVLRNHVLTSRRVNAHVVLVASMNMHEPVVIGTVHLSGLLPQLGEDPLHLGVLVVERLFRTLTMFVMLFGMVRLVNGVISVFILTPCHQLLVLLALDLIRRTPVGLLTVLHRSLFARGGP